MPSRFPIHKRTFVPSLFTFELKQMLYNTVFALVSMDEPLSRRNISHRINACNTTGSEHLSRGHFAIAMEAFAEQEKAANDCARYSDAWAVHEKGIAMRWMFVCCT